MGTDKDPIEIECPSCDGQGCDECAHGFVRVIGCPNNYCREVATAISLFSLFDKGLPPIAGGVLDQSAWFIEASKVMQSEQNKIEAERYAN